MTTATLYFDTKVENIELKTYFNHCHDCLLSGKNVTSEYEQLYPRLDKAVEHAVTVSERKIRDLEPDINFRAALALADWRPTHPLERAAEYFEFDFEFGDEPEDTSIKSNAKVVKG